MLQHRFLARSFCARYHAIKPGRIFGRYVDIAGSGGAHGAVAPTETGQFKAESDEIPANKFLLQAAPSFRSGSSMARPNAMNRYHID
jgi:hypothetical protein